uniref:serine/threonine-protein kinase n=1 Tax=Frankia sp. CiP1_Cm_nod1 TaxID=2897160 RepID=UPI0020259E4F
MQPLRSDDPTQVGPYRLVGRLGAGGMGRVYLGRSPAGRAVAVKVVRPELADDPQFRDRFGREVRAARAVSGAYTAAVIDADPAADRPWLATAYVPGLSLAETIRRTGPLPQEAVRTLAAGLAEALAAVHRAGLVHRDLKPSNVLLATDGPRVIDFGISRAADATGLTLTGGVLGSPGFMAPEQITGGEIGPPCDVFALGALIAFAATGREPFGTGPTPALVYRLVHAEPTLDGLDGDLRELVTVCLAKDPAARPALTDMLARLTGQDQETTVLRPGPGWLPPPVADVLSAHTAATGTDDQPSDADQPSPAAPVPVPVPVTPAPVPAVSGTDDDGPHARPGPGDVRSPVDLAGALAEATTTRSEALTVRAEPGIAQSETSTAQGETTAVQVEPAPAQAATATPQSESATAQVEPAAPQVAAAITQAVAREPAAAPLTTSRARRRRGAPLVIGAVALVVTIVAIVVGLAATTNGSGGQGAAAGDARLEATASPAARPTSTSAGSSPDPSATTSAGMSTE